MILDTYQSAKYLNALELGVLDEVLTVFRESLFDPKVNVKEELDSILGFPSEDVYTASQIILEFMDKGMKGLLTGDLSAYAVKQI